MMIAHPKGMAPVNYRLEQKREGLDRVIPRLAVDAQVRICLSPR
jgi:hypothetical protein